MLTECPSCHTVFRVTSAILKMGHGQVRCGKCQTQFDALESLLDEEAEELSPQPEPEAEAEQDIQAEEPAIGEDITLEGSRIEISGTYRVPDEDTEPGEEPHEQVIHEHVLIDRDEPEEPEEQELENVEEFIVAPDDGEPVAEAAEHLLGESQQHADATPIAQRLWQRVRGRDRARHAEFGEIAAELDALTKPQAAPGVSSTVWLATAAVMVITLIAQAIHHSRDQLVRSPKWGPTVTRLYKSLGLKLTPNWELAAYELQQWGVVSDSEARDALRVRASVTNTATFSQPYPYVKLTLQDRWGATVASREFAPAEYLPSAAMADRMMAPRQRANAEIVIVDPGADAVGFQIYACLPQGSGTLCSDDLPAHP